MSRKELALFLACSTRFSQEYTGVSAMHYIDYKICTLFVSGGHFSLISECYGNLLHRLDNINLKKKNPYDYDVSDITRRFLQMIGSLDLDYTSHHFDFVALSLSQPKVWLKSEDLQR